MKRITRAVAGRATIAIPPAVRGEIVKHLMTYVDSRPDALVFTGPKGGALRRAHFNNLTRWVETVSKLGVPGLHFHDLRHTGNHLAAQTGASTKDLMARMGHDDMRAALIYQRATQRGGPADRRPAERPRRRAPEPARTTGGRGCGRPGPGAADRT